MDASSRMGVARTLDPSEGNRRTHTLASVEPLSFDLGQGAESAADRLYPLGFYPSVPNGLHLEALPPSLVPKAYEGSPHPGVSPYRRRRRLDHPSARYDEGRTRL